MIFLANWLRHGGEYKQKKLHTICIYFKNLKFTYCQHPNPSLDPTPFRTTPKIIPTLLQNRPCLLSKSTPLKPKIISTLKPTMHPKINLDPYKYISNPILAMWTLAKIHSHFCPKSTPHYTKVAQFCNQICPHFALETFKRFKVCSSYGLRRHS